MNVHTTRQSRSEEPAGAWSEATTLSQRLLAVPPAVRRQTVEMRRIVWASEQIATTIFEVKDDTRP